MPVYGGGLGKSDLSRRQWSARDYHFLNIWNQMERIMSDLRAERANHLIALLKMTDTAWDDKKCVFNWVNGTGLLSPILMQAGPVIESINAVDGEAAESIRSAIANLMRILAIRCWKGEPWRHHSIPILERALEIRLNPIMEKALMDDILGILKAHKQDIERRSIESKAAFRRSVKQVLLKIAIYCGVILALWVVGILKNLIFPNSK